MIIAGLQKNSLVDYPGKMAAVIFTPGCNMNCFYCHNRHLLGNKPRELIFPGYVFEFLEKRKNLLDGVVISGGEPTLQQGLWDFIDRVKKMGYLVKLDTNGTNPELVGKLISDNMLDYIAMDIKAPFSRYKEICGTDVNMDNIKRSINLLLQGRVDYEFRTTYVPELSKEDIEEMAGYIEGARLYALQQFRCPQSDEAFFDIRNGKKPHSEEYIIETRDLVKNKVKNCKIRGINSI